MNVTDVRNQLTEFNPIKPLRWGPGGGAPSPSGGFGGNPPKSGFFQERLPPKKLGVRAGASLAPQQSELVLRSQVTTKQVNNEWNWGLVAGVGYGISTRSTSQN